MSNQVLVMAMWDISDEVAEGTEHTARNCEELMQQGQQQSSLLDRFKV